MEIVKIIPSIPFPQRGTSRSLGLDFVSPTPGFLLSGETQIIGLGKKISVPLGKLGLPIARSNMVWNGLFVLGGVIGDDYRSKGEGRFLYWLYNKIIFVL